MSLYPPIIDTFIPAFSITEVPECRIYFALSKANSKDEIKSVQLIVRNQETNYSALDLSTYPMEIKVYSEIQEDTTKTTDDRYYITLKPSDLQGGFQINQYYKTQIRFGSVAAPVNKDDISSWLVENTGSFSEWSTICLIHGISKPSLNLLYFTNPSETVSLNTDSVSVIGKLQFASPEEKEILKSYQTKLIDTTTKKILADSGIQYSSMYADKNELKYTFNYLLTAEQQYEVEISYTTNNLYQKTETYKCVFTQGSAEELPVTLNVIPNLDEGCMEIQMSSTVTQTAIVAFRRSSSKTNFTIWEDIHIVKITDSLLNYTWKDNTIQSGVWYSYCVQRVDENGNRSVVTKAPKPAIATFEDTFLNGNGQQLCLKFNTQVSSVKRNIADSKVDTIGSKYPFIKRSGAMNYRQYSISGLVSCLMDENKVFATEDTLYGNAQVTSLYKDYNFENNISEWNNSTLEREFREKVSEFLHDGQVKLWRSETEGNVLVRLMDISFTPEQTLGRMIYSFSATAYEIDDCTLSNIFKYKVIDKVKGQLDEGGGDIPTEKAIKINQLSEVIPANTEVISTLSQPNQTVDNLEQLRIEFVSNPYLIKENDFGDIAPAMDGTGTLFGYIVVINNATIFVNPEGIYTLGKGIKVTSLFFPTDTEVKMDFVANMTIKKVPVRKRMARTMAIPRMVKATSNQSNIGQLWETFKYNESVIQKIKDKYLINYPNYHQELIAVNKLKIEADVGTICIIKDSYTQQPQRFVIGETETLTIYNENAVILDLTFGGVHLNATASDVPASDEFIDTHITRADISEISNPVVNGVYTINSQKKIFYKGQWCDFTNENDVICDTSAIVDYLCDITKGVIS